MPRKRSRPPLPLVVTFSTDPAGPTLRDLQKGPAAGLLARLFVAHLRSRAAPVAASPVVKAS